MNGSRKTTTGNEDLQLQQLDYDQQEISDFDEWFYFYLWTVTTPAVFALITMVGVVGNLAVIHFIVSQRSRHSPTNILLVNLALADLAFLAVCVPFTAVKYVALSWPLGDVTCKLVQYLLYVTAYVTVYTLVAVSALRYVIVVCDGQRVATWCRRPISAVVCASAIWVVSLTCNGPAASVHTVKTFAGSDYVYCGLVDAAIGPIIVSFFIIGYALPLTAITVLYLLIVCHLRRHEGASHGPPKPSYVAATSTSGQMVTTHHVVCNAPMSIRSQTRNARTLRLVVLVVVVFGLSWLPNHVQSLAAYFGARAPEGAVYEVFRVLWNCMAYGNSCANPIIYHYGAATSSRKGSSCCWCYDTRDQQTGQLSVPTASSPSSRNCIMACSCCSQRQNKPSGFRGSPGTATTTRRTTISGQTTVRRVTLL